MLIFINENYLQALEKIVYSNNWITIVLLLMFIGVVFLKAINKARLKGMIFSLFKISYIEYELENRKGFFDVFKIGVFLFSVFVLSLLLFSFKAHYQTLTVKEISSFYPVFTGVLSYFLIKKILENILCFLFLIKEEVLFFMVSKSSYLYAISFLIYMAILLNTYSGFSKQYLFYFTVFLFSIRFVIHVILNKKLIFNKLFYFILYICAFEIAPLFILFKLMF